MFWTKHFHPYPLDKITTKRYTMTINNKINYVLYMYFNMLCIHVNVFVLYKCVIVLKVG